jgi:outer membrane protein assembly factor BamD (BamD/ComL family)
VAEKAMLRSADHYYATSEFDLAADTYAMYVKSYPRSPMVPRARLRQAYSNLAQFRGLKFDASRLVDARAQLVNVAALYPQLAADENLLDLCQRIDQTFAAKILTTADFYRRTDAPAAAIYYYRFLAATYPNSAEARQAEQALKRFPPSALKAPSPRPGDGYAPPAQPVYR